MKATASRDPTPPSRRGSPARRRRSAAAPPRGSGPRASAPGRARARRPRASPTASSLGGGAEDDAGIEIGLAAHEATGYPGAFAGLQHEVEALPRRVRDRHQDEIRLRCGRAPGRSPAASRSPAPPGAGGGEATGRRPRARRRARPASRAARAAGCGRRVRRRRSASGAASCGPGSCPGRGRGRARRSASRRRARSRRAHRRRRCRAGSRPTAGSPTGSRRRGSPRRGRRDDAGRVACARVAPDAAVEAERDERRVAREQHDRQRDRRDMPAGSRVPPPDGSGSTRRERDAHQREVDDDLDEPAPVRDERGEGAVRRLFVAVDLRRGSCRTGRAARR